MALKGKRSQILLDKWEKLFKRNSTLKEEYIKYVEKYEELMSQYEEIMEY